MNEQLLSVKHIKKKFSRSLRRSLVYGMMEVVGMKSSGSLRKTEYWALNDINFDLNAGDILGIVGNNGSGKTTLMRLIAGIYIPSSGNITIKPETRVIPLFALRAGMQPLYSGMDNIYLKCAMFGMSKAETMAQLDFIIDFSELEDHIHTPFGNYSMGMRARLAYACAMAAQPDILIVDEALAVGDTRFKVKCYENLKSMAREPGKGVIFVTNHVEKLLKIANRLIILDKGQLIESHDNVKTGLESYIDHISKTRGDKAADEITKMIRSYEQFQN